MNIVSDQKNSNVQAKEKDCESENKNLIWYGCKIWILRHKISKFSTLDNGFGEKCRN